MSEACSTQEEECTSQQILKDPLGVNSFESADEQIILLKDRILKLEQELQSLKNSVNSKQALESSSPDIEEVVELRTDISLDEVKKQVLTYVKSHKHAKTSDIIFDLGIDPELVVEALETLEEENEVVSRDIQTVFQ